MLAKTMEEKAEWQHEKDFVDEETGITVRVNCLPLRDPLYSIEIGRNKGDGFLRRHIAAMPGCEEIIMALLDAMSMYLEQKWQERVMDQEKREAEMRERKEAKKAQWMANRERRREENRERARRLGSGKKKEKK